MKPKNVIVWILLLGIVVLLMSTSVQAKDEVNANAILEKIENGEDIYLENVHIVGELNLSEIELKTIPNRRSEWEIYIYDLEEELKIVESEIQINDSVFEDDFDFSNTQFRKTIDIRGTTFLGEVDFRGVDFTGDANFVFANFARGAYFEDANFAGVAYFEDANFTGDANFRSAVFSGSAYFWDANFAGVAYFEDANFAFGAYFVFANFSNYAYFRQAIFSGDADFRNANFTDNARFDDANFTGDARFEDANFAGFAYFEDANFARDAHFVFANFARGAYFEDANFARGAYFEDANFARGATFFSTKFDKVSFIGTTFTYVFLKETDFNQMNVEWSTLKDALVFDGLTYIKLIKNFREMEQFEDADAAYYQYRRLSQADKKWSFSKLMDVVAGVSCGYGVKPGYPLIWGFGLIMLFTLVYWRGDGIKRLKENNGDKNRVSRWAAFYNAFYFSVVTFTTVGYGDWYPEDRYRIVVMIEGVLGWLLLALFIVTLANVMIRP